MFLRWATALVLAFSCWTVNAVAQSKIFVASSLTDLFEELATETEPGAFQIVPGGSSTIARQIKAGAPAALFVSANKEWAEFVAQDREMIPLFSNSLVVVSADDAVSIKFEDLAGLLSSSRLAIADPNHVPAGIYAQQAFENSGAWLVLQTRLAPFDNVRAAARAVQIGAAKFGVVYASDAEALGLNVVFTFPSDVHDPIEYWAVILDPNDAEVGRILTLAKSDAARDIVERFGFKQRLDDVK